MNPKNITGLVRIVATLVWFTLSATLPAIYLPQGIAMLVGVAAGVIGAKLIIYTLRGDRIWIRDGKHAPIGFMLKPRGFSTDSSLGGKGDSDGTATCPCGRTFEVAYDHMRTDSDNYCPECSKVGEAVMKNYKSWLPETKDVREE